MPEGRFVIENAWPIPAADGASRGVVVEGAVFSPAFGRFRFLRYEVRRWPGGTIDDVAWAADGPQRLTADVDDARRVLALVGNVPPYVWGRRVPGTTEMWNSNSVIAWLLARAGIPMQGVEPPLKGRAPGWESGLRLGSRRGVRT